MAIFFNSVRAYKKVYHASFYCHATTPCIDSWPAVESLHDDDGVMYQSIMQWYGGNPSVHPSTSCNSDHPSDMGRRACRQ